MMDTILDLDTRSGWPADLRYLIECYPREIWEEHVNLGELARFWLQIHEGFRSLGEDLKARTADFREGVTKPKEFRNGFAPRLQTMLTHLHGHHQIEDFHFFPLFARVEPRLATGFDVLERDHEAIHEAVALTVDHARGLLAASDIDADALRRAADAYAGSHEALLKRLDRHLLDEEDLIIPIILDRGEGPLGI